MSENPERTGNERAQTAATRGAAEGLIEHTHNDRVSLRRLLVPAGLFLISFLYILGGLVNRQLIEAEDYDEQFRVQSSRVIQVPAPRGHIYDRNSKLIVGNRARYNIVADLGVLREEIRFEYLRRIRDARAKGVKIDSTLIQNASRIAVLQHHLDRVNRALGRNELVDGNAFRNHVLKKRALDFPLVTDIPPEDVAKFAENFRSEDPLRLYVDCVRTYPYGDSASHALGYLSNTDDLGEDPDEDEKLKVLRKLKYPGKVGAAGLELAFNDELQGKPGSRVWMVNPNGYLYKLISETKAEQGAHIYCSLDIELQQAAEKALAEAGKGAGLNGALVALDVDTGEILAMASYPRFDPNKFADRVSSAYMSELRETGGELNRATQGVYPPGSTFKIVSAIAAMRAGKLTPEETFECGRFYEVGGRLWPEHDGAAFGEVNLARMLAVSCNVYCYQIGLRIGGEILGAEARRFGLNEKIRIETATAQAASLIVGDPKWKTDNGYSGWSSGDTLNAVIGQGFTRTTPLHMACMITSVAGKRTRTKPTLLHDPSHDGLTLDHGGTSIDMTVRQYDGLIAGLRACVEAGTAKSVKYPKNAPPLLLDVAGKTGTAQFPKNGRDTNLAWFVGFAPIENPRIALAVMLEGDKGVNLHGGADAGPIARAVLKKWVEQTEKHAEANADTPAQ